MTEKTAVEAVYHFSWTDQKKLDEFYDRYKKDALTFGSLFTRAWTEKTESKISVTFSDIRGATEFSNFALATYPLDLMYGDMELKPALPPKRRPA